MPELVVETVKVDPPPSGASFTCLRCGQCCRRNMLLLPEELEVFKELLGERFNEFLDGLTFVEDKVPYFRFDGVCPFLIQDSEESLAFSHRCELFDSNKRPLVCKKYPLDGMCVGQKGGDEGVYEDIVKLAQNTIRPEATHHSALSGLQFLIVQGACELGSSEWFEWVVVNPTGTAEVCTEVRVKCTDDTDMDLTVDVQGYPVANWADGGTNGLYWSGSEVIPAYSAVVFRCRATLDTSFTDKGLTWSCTITGETVADRTSTLTNVTKGSTGGLFYNLPDDETEQTEAGTFPNGLYAYADQDVNTDPLLLATQYVWYINLHSWYSYDILAGGTLTITVPKEFTSVSLKDKTDFTDAVVTGGGASDWTITGTNDSAVINDVIHLSFYATTPATGSQSLYEFHSQFIGVGDVAETIRMYCELCVEIAYIGTLTGITKDKDGNVLGSCALALFKNNGDGTYTYLQNTTSDAVTGAYSFTVTADPADNFMIYGFKSGSPDRFDATDNSLNAVKT